MVIDNFKATISVKIRKFVMAIIAMLLIILCLMTELFKFWKDSQYHISFIVAGLFLLFVVFEYARNLHYFYFTNEGPKLIFRFYTMRIFQHVKKAVEIPVNTLYKFEINRGFAGFRTELVIYQKIDRKIVKYPAINISLLKKQEKTDLANTLKKHALEK
ncbi:MAG: hypothetical protein ABIJ16_00505 [Bacteroidota bacterium]